MGICVSVSRYHAVKAQRDNALATIAQMRAADVASLTGDATTVEQLAVREEMVRMEYETDEAFIRREVLVLMNALGRQQALTAQEDKARLAFMRQEETLRSQLAQDLAVKLRETEVLQQLRHAARKTEPTAVRQ